MLTHHGWGALREELRDLVHQERWDDLVAVVPDEVLDEFCTAATYPELASALGRRWSGLVTTVQIPAPAPNSAHWDGLAEACAAVCRL